MGGGHSWESCAPACQSCLPRPLSFSTPRFQQAQAGHRIDELFGAGAIRKVRNQGEDREVENGVRGDGYAQKPSKRPRKDLPVSGVTNSASFRPGEKRAIRGA